jgi:diguanylate cyclase (GGDEF)-like protein/PAS domain S-box-containing protein
MHVLVVETEPTLRRSLELALAMRGHTLSAAMTAAAAVEQVRVSPVPLILIGDLLAGPDAVNDLCRDLRQIPHGEAATILVIAPRNESARIVAALDAGADGYLARPLEAAQLRAHLERSENEPLRPIEPPALPESSQRARALIDNAVDIMLIVDPSGEIAWAAPPVAAVLGRRPAALPGTNLYSIVHPEDADRLTVLLDRAQAEAEVEPVDLRLRRQDGVWRFMDVRGLDLRHMPAVEGIVLTARDITERHVREERTLRQSLYDPLTGLPNRAVFLTYLEHALARSERRAEPVVVMFLDIDDFAILNERHGRHIGDQVLAGVAKRLRTALRATDTAARMGDDEFTVLLEGVESADEATVVAERIREEMEAPFTFGEDQLQASASIGMAFSLPGATTLTGESRQIDLLRRADRALSSAKTGGKGRWVIYEPGSDLTRNQN